MTVDEYAAKIAELDSELKRLERERDAELKRLRAALVPIYRYELKIVVDTWRQPIHASYGVVSLVRTTTNYDELRTKGWTGDQRVGMQYYYSKLTGRFIAPVGGGTILIDDPEDFRKLGVFLRANPEGGDVTEIMQNVTTSWMRANKS